ncbi:YjcZ family sporulation protein [Bacillus cereus]|nr:YjcZ family sporulation protein [Bacillus cereus]
MGYGGSCGGGCGFGGGFALLVVLFISKRTCSFCL